MPYLCDDRTCDLLKSALIKLGGEDIRRMSMRSGSQERRKGHRQWAVLLTLTVTCVALVGHSAGNLIERLTSTEATSVSDETPAPVDVISRKEVDVPSDPMEKPIHYNSGNASEKIAKLPVPVSANERHKRVIFSLAVPDLSSGDVLQVMSEFQVTNDLGFNVMCMTQIILADSEAAVSGTEITEANGRNVTPDAHHDSFPKVGSLTVTTTGTRYVNVVAWCASSNATKGSSITVDADYGRLSILRY